MPVNFGTLYRALDAVVALSDIARKFSGSPPPQPPAPDADAGLVPQQPPPGLSGHIEARLTNVLVAALREAFDRDHARLELERTQVEDQRRRAEEALQQELRRQAVERETGRLRLLAGTALLGWIASVALLVARLGTATGVSRALVAFGWILLLGSLASAFSAQARLGAPASAAPGESDADGRLSAAALWLLVAGLAVTAISLLV